MLDEKCADVLNTLVAQPPRDWRGDTQKKTANGAGQEKDTMNSKVRQRACVIKKKKRANPNIKQTSENM